MAKRSPRKHVRSREIPAKIAAAGAGAQGLPVWLNRDWIFGLLLIGAVILAYLPIWQAGYIWDDDQVLTANPVIVGPLGLKEIWTTRAADICPLTLTTFWVEHALWGLAPLPYHLVNVLMHGVCAVVLWRVLRSLRVPGAWLGAALWALHPVQVESVAWIVEMKNTQSCLFFLLSILFFVRWLRAGTSGERSAGNWDYVLTLLFSAMAMASKSSTVILPVVLCLCAWWVQGRWQWRNFVKVGPIILMSVAATLVSMWTQGLQLATEANAQLARSWPDRLAMAGDAVWFYLGKLVWPHPLITVYPGWEINAGQSLSYLPLLTVTILMVVLWFKRESSLRPWFFVYAYFIVGLLPTLGLVDNYIFRYSLVFDHFQYLASMGPLALAAAGMVWAANALMPGRCWQQTGLCAGVLLLLGLVSWQRAWAYESDETLWADTLAQNPNCSIAHSNVGEALFEKGKIDEAMDEFQKAVAINPHLAKPHYNLGVALFQKGQVNEAIEEYQKDLEIYPNDALAHNNLGNALSQQGHVDAAMAEYQKALEIDPNHAEAHNDLANILAQKGQMDDAMVQYHKALEINPNFAEAHNNLAGALFLKGRLDDAIAQYKEALRLKPDYTAAQVNLAKVEAMQQQASKPK
jgi:tetratricopeptide (TPR) repeat protein